MKYVLLICVLSDTQFPSKMSAIIIKQNEWMTLYPLTIELKLEI